MNRKTFLQSISAAIVGFFGVKAVKKDAPVGSSPSLGIYPGVWSVKGKDLNAVINRHKAKGAQFG